MLKVVRAERQAHIAIIIHDPRFRQSASRPVTMRSYSLLSTSDDGRVVPLHVCEVVLAYLFKCVSEVLLYMLEFFRLVSLRFWRF